jgi:hypothetical protein
MQVLRSAPGEMGAVMQVLRSAPGENVDGFLNGQAKTAFGSTIGLTGKGIHPETYSLETDSAAMRPH